MSHTTEKRWPGLSNDISNASSDLLKRMNSLKELFLETKDVYSYCANSDTKLANLLFYGDKDLTTASATEVTMAKELFDAAKVFDELHDFLNNVVVTDKDRAKTLRNMS